MAPQKRTTAKDKGIDTTARRSKIKVHFMAPLTGNREDFKRVYSVIQSLGYSTITDHILHRTLEQVNAETRKESEQWARQLHAWIKAAQIVVYEVSTPNVSVGYEIGLAFADFIPVILLYRKGSGEEPHGLKGIDNELLQIIPYTDAELPALLEGALEQASEQLTRRTYLSFPPAIFQYLRWVERRYDLPLSMYVRNLVEQDMRDNIEYQAILGNVRT